MEEFKNLTRCPVPGCNKVESGVNIFQAEVPSGTEINEFEGSQGCQI